MENLEDQDGGKTNPNNKITIEKDSNGTKIKYHKIKLAGIEKWDIKNSDLNSRGSFGSARGLNASDVSSERSARTTK